MRTFLYCLIIIILSYVTIGCSKAIDKIEQRVIMQDDILKEMDSRGLKRVSESISKEIRNAIKLDTLKLNESDISIGKTKIGGKPDVPNDFDWPQ